jgi:Phosphotransferase System HPr (HPr) Family
MQDTSQADETPGGLETTVVIRDELGLHARPAARLAQAAQQFASDITLEYDDMTVDAKSILDILSLAAGRGASLKLRCNGTDADTAAKTLEELFSREGGIFARNG